MTTHEPSAVRIAVIGDRIQDFPPQDAIASALQHSAARRPGLACDVSWHATPSLESEAAVALREADGIWCAPGSPYASLDGALAGIRVARERGVPFLGTCAGFQHGVLEVARNVLGVTDAQHQEYLGGDGVQPLFVEELLCSLVGQTMAVQLTDRATRELYGADEAIERYYCRFGLNETFRPQLAAAGLVVAGVDPVDGGTRIMRLRDHPFYLLTLFVPQTSSRPGRTHPIIDRLLDAAVTRSAGRHDGTGARSAN